MNQAKAEPTPVPVLFVNFFGSVGGGQVQLLSILDGLDPDAFTPYVVCCQDGPFTDMLRARGLEPIFIPFGKGKRRHLTVALPAFWRFYRLAKQLKVRLVHAHGLQEAKLAAYPCALLHIPMVWVVAP